MSLSLTPSLAYPRVTTVGDFFALLKPRVMSLVVFTGLAGLVAAPGHLHPLTAFTALLCIAVAAGASGCLNMAYDSDIDRLMSRTATRPIPMGTIARDDALAFGWTLSVAAVAIFSGWRYSSPPTIGFMDSAARTSLTDIHPHCRATA